MMYRHVFSLFLFCVVFSLCLSCAGSPPPGAVPESGAEENSTPPGEEVSPFTDTSAIDPPVRPQPVLPDPEDLVFVPEEFSVPEAVPGVGLITRERRDRGASLGEDERAALAESFRNAYTDSLLRGAPLSGVLGGDLVHGWPENLPSGWVQNWRASVAEANSWGLPALILAVRGIRTGMDLGRVFTVRGKVLDRYGKSAGINGANGDMGYGSPRGYEFVYEGKIAQRFDLGLITVDREGRADFRPEEPPSFGVEPPSGTGVFSGEIPAALSRENLRAAFETALKMALDRGAESMIPDGPGRYLSSSEGSRDFLGVETLNGFYAQSFNRGSAALVLPDSARLPPYPRLISDPYLEPLLNSSKYALPGGENSVAPGLESAGDDGFFRSLAEGFARCGIPLTDPMPYGGEESPLREAQRFSRGWLVRRD